MVYDHASKIGATADAQIEDTREDRHGNRRRLLGRKADGVVLAGYVERRGHGAPHDAHGEDGNDIHGSRLHQQQTQRRTQRDHKHEPPSARHIILGEGDAAQHARGAKDDEHHRHHIGRQACHLIQEGFDVAVARIVSGGKEQRQHKEAQQHAVVEQRRNLGKRELAAALQPGKYGGDEDEYQSRDDGDTQKRHAPAHVQSHHAAYGQTYDHSHRRPRGHRAQPQCASAVGHRAHSQRRGYRPEYRVGTRHAYAREHQRVIALGERRCHMAHHKEGDDGEQQPLELHRRHHHHEGQRHERHHPRIDRHQQSCPHLADVQVGGNVAEQTYGHKL